MLLENASVDAQIDIEVNTDEHFQNQSDLKPKAVTVDITYPQKTKIMLPRQCSFCLTCQCSPVDWHDPFWIMMHQPLSHSDKLTTISCKYSTENLTNGHGEAAEKISKEVIQIIYPKYLKEIIRQ